MTGLEIVAAIAIGGAVSGAAGKYYHSKVQRRKNIGKPFKEYTKKQVDEDGIPFVFTILIDRLTNNHAIEEKYIFLEKGDEKRDKKLIKAFDSHERPQKVDLKGYNNITLANVLKHFLTELPECLIPDEIKSSLRDFDERGNDNVEGLRLIINLAPDLSRNMLKQLLSLLNSISQNSLVNEMTSAKLARAIAPCIFHIEEIPPELPDNQLLPAHYQHSLRLLIEQHEEIMLRDSISYEFNTSSKTLSYTRQ